MTGSVQKILAASGRPERAKYDWSQFCHAYESRYGQALSTTGKKIEDFATFFGRSLFLSQRVIQQPELADQLLRSDFFQKEKPLERFVEELEAAVDPVSTDWAGVARVLRHYRYEETLRLTVQELANLSSFDALGRQRSSLAIASLQVVYNLLYKDLCRNYGQPVDENRQPSTFCILGMGKLGGDDLNYSSDIDLIFFYSSDAGGMVKAPKEADVTHHQFFVRLGERLSRLLMDNTEDGFVYRVDCDLRPEGRQGTLVNAIDAMEDYYESFGDNWERMALIKARPVAGSTTLGKDFCERIRPFVYPGVADLNLLDQIRDLKSKIEDSLRHKLTGEADPDRPGYNVKLGAGGIREIEFFVSSLQHLYGGKDPELRVRHTLTAAKQLVAKGLLSSEDAQALTAAYHFLRTTENRLQMVEDRQTHTLPRQAEELETVTGLAAELFYERLQQHTGAVRRLWEQLLNRP